MINNNITFNMEGYDIISSHIMKKYDLEKVNFFDIECTGFNKEDDKVFCISIGKFKDNKFIVNCFFNAYSEEKLLLEAYKNFDNVNICTFNGTAFDVPFLNSRFNNYGINNLAFNKHYDFYRILIPYVNNLGCEGKSLKSFESFWGIKRNDSLSGELCKDKFIEYLTDNSEDKLHDIIRHNLEDVFNLPKLFEIVNYISENNIDRDDVIDKKKYLYIKKLLKNRKINNCAFDRKYTSQKDAGKLIYELKRKNVNKEIINDIIKEINDRSDLC